MFALASIFDRIEPDYALASTAMLESNLTIQMSGYLFDDQHTYFCLFDLEFTSDVTIDNPCQSLSTECNAVKNFLECKGPKVHLNETHAFDVRVYRDDGYLIRKFS